MTDKLPEDDQPINIPHVHEDDALIDEIEHYDGPSLLLRKLSEFAKGAREGSGPLGGSLLVLAILVAGSLLGATPTAHATPAHDPWQVVTTCEHDTESGPNGWVCAQAGIPFTR